MDKKIKLKPHQVIDEYYLELRCKVLEIAAILDRFDRAVKQHDSEQHEKDKRLEKCLQSIAILNQTEIKANRTEQICLLFSEKCESKTRTASNELP